MPHNRSDSQLRHASQSLGQPAKACVTCGCAGATGQEACRTYSPARIPAPASYDGLDAAHGWEWEVEGHEMHIVRERALHEVTARLDGEAGVEIEAILPTRLFEM